MYGLELRGLVWACGDRRHRFDTDPVWVDRGDVVAVVAQAAVATALADTVTGLACPVAGSIRAKGKLLVVGDGRPAARLPAPELIALVPAGGGLLPHLSVARNIEFNLDRGGTAAARATEVSDLAEQFHLDGALSMAPPALSAEQRLRVAAARALARHPEVLVVEDRGGEAPCGPLVAAATGVAVLVISDSPARAEDVASVVHHTREEEPADAGQS